MTEMNVTNPRSAGPIGDIFGDFLQVNPCAAVLVVALALSGRTACGSSNAGDATPGLPHELPNRAEANTAGLPANRYRPTGRPQFGTAMVDMKHVR
jgi:hypothetical protein